MGACTGKRNRVTIAESVGLMSILYASVCLTKTDSVVPLCVWGFPGPLCRA
jgi:hypothetical protein